MRRLLADGLDRTHANERHHPDRAPVAGDGPTVLGVLQMCSLAILQ